jgi:hypothetical protein
MININKMIDYMLELKAKGITYSMFGSRDGSDGTGDCSGTVVRSVEKAGGSKPDYLYSTETMHGYLLANGFKLVYVNNETYNPIKGDIFIWGKKGQSAGAAGHTGIFYDDKENIIHTNARVNGVSIDNVNDIMAAEGYPYYYIYRPNQETPSPKPTPTPPPVKRRFGYRVDDLQIVNGVWQIRNNYLCPVDFDWTDNGIQPVDVDKIESSTGANHQNQVLSVGDYFAFKPDCVIGADTPVMIKGWQFMRVTLKHSGVVWLSIYNTNHLIYG